MTLWVVDGIGRLLRRFVIQTKWKNIIFSHGFSSNILALQSERWKLSEIDLNTLYSRYIRGEKNLKAALFEALDARFRLFVRRRVGNTEDGNEMIQNALLTISTELDKTEIRVSFAAWAYKILDFRIKAYIKDRTRSQKRSVSIDDADLAEFLPSKNIDPIFKRGLLLCLGKIRQANSRYARVLNYKNQGYTSTEICDRLGLTHTNLYSILSRARSMLLQCLKNGDLR